MVEDLKTTSDYLKIAQQVFNKFIRVRDAGLNCISCNKPCKKKMRVIIIRKADTQTLGFRKKIVIFNVNIATLI
jgi:CO dehydrogenase/acetyl-CoA synthase alpha subunit